MRVRSDRCAKGALPAMPRIPAWCWRWITYSAALQAASVPETSPFQKSSAISSRPLQRESLTERASSRALSVSRRPRWLPRRAHRRREYWVGGRGRPL